MNMLVSFRPHLEWVANSFQSSSAAVLPLWGYLKLCSSLGWAKLDFSVAFLTVTVVGLLLMLVVYPLMLNAYLIAFRGVGMLRDDQDFKEISSWSWHKQIKALFFGFFLISLYFPLLTADLGAEKSAWLTLFPLFLLYPFIYVWFVKLCWRYRK